LIRLLDTHDISNATATGEDTAILDNLFGFVARERQIQFPDGRAEYNPFAENSVFRSNTWRNGAAVSTDKFGATEFFGAINDISYTSSKEGRMVSVSAREQFATLLQWVVEDLNLISDPTTAYQYSMSGAHAVGATSLTLNDTGSPDVITVGSFISFGLFNVPRYQVTEVTAGTPTPSIKIDRGLEYAVADTTVLRVMEPVQKTGAEAVRDALAAAGMGAYIGSSFDSLDTTDRSDGNLLRLFVRYENKVTLSDHIKKLCDMCDMYITTNKNGVINVIRGRQYDGYLISTEVTDSELIKDVSIAFDKSQIYYAYDTLYNSGGQVKIASDQVTAATLSRWAAKDRWQPVSASSASVDSYQYLYDSETAADFFGARKIAYSGVPRARLTAACKAYPTGNQRAPYNFSIGSKVLLTHNLGGGKSLYREPAIVTKRTYDRAKQFYPVVELELTNWIYPNLSYGSARPPAAVVSSYMLTEGGNRIITESGSFIIKE